VATNPGNPHEYWLRGLPTFKTKMAKWSKKVGFLQKFFLPNHFKTAETQIKMTNDQKPKYKNDHKKEEGMYPLLLFFIGII
jgi:hypothetical protein